jgi:hypothetical protein
MFSENKKEFPFSFPFRPKAVCGPSLRSPPTPPRLFRHSAAVLQAAAQLGPYRSPVQSPYPSQPASPRGAHLGPAGGTHRPPPGLQRSPAPPRLGVRAGDTMMCAPYLASRASPLRPADAGRPLCAAPPAPVARAAAAGVKLAVAAHDLRLLSTFDPS